MDDWNDFGNVFPPSDDHPYPDSSHSQSSLPTYSDSSAPYLEAASNSNLPIDLNHSSTINPTPSLDDAVRDSARLLGPSTAPSSNSHNTNNSTNNSTNNNNINNNSNNNNSNNNNSNNNNSNNNNNNNTQQIDEDIQVNNEMEGSSDSDGAEPRSVMMRPTRRGLITTNPLEEDQVPHFIDGDPDNDDNNNNDDNNSSDNNDNVHSPQRIYTPRRGDLDDIPDDYELNIEGFRFTAVKSLNSTSDGGVLGGGGGGGGDGEPTSSPIASSLLRHLDKSYMKLEVISAKQIRTLVNFFNIFFLIAILYTTFMVVVSNTVYEDITLQPLPISLLREEQRQNGLGPLFLEKRPSATVITRKASLFSNLESTFATRFHQEEQDSSYDFSTNCFNCPKSNTYQSYCEMLSQNENGLGPLLCDEQTRSREYPNLHSTTPRQDGDDSSSSNISSKTHYTFFSVPLISVTLPLSLRLIHQLLSLTLAIFFFVLSMLYLARLMYIKRRNITHEQIWVFILLLVTFLYFDIIETIMDAVSIIRLFRNVEAEAFPSWLNKISDVFESIRIASFTTFSYFYLWASLHSYRILDPEQKLGFYWFYLPKFIVLFPLLIFHLSIFHSLGLEFSEIPLLSAPAFAYIFSPYRLWYYLRWEMVLTIVKSLWDFLLIAILFYEASKTMRVLEQAPYMKYRAKRVGFRFFLYINFMFYFGFCVLHWITMFGRPVGNAVIRVTPPSDAPRAGVEWFSTTGVWFLLCGYVLCTASVHLPYTSVGWFKGWIKSSTLAASGSQWSRTWSDLKGLSEDNSNPKSSSTNNDTTLTVPTSTVARLRNGINIMRLNDPNSLSKNKQSIATTLSSATGGGGIHSGGIHSGDAHTVGINSIGINSGGVISNSGGGSANINGRKKSGHDLWSQDEDEIPASLVDNDSELQQQIVEPITYRKRESKDSLELKANCFTMQTHVIMFNFAWYVYYYGTPKLDKFQPRENPLPFEFVVDRHMKSIATDTQALVLDCTDRIIVTFKGTTSMKNLRTSIKVNHELLSNVVRLNADGEDESERLKKLFGHRYLQAKIHQGFATAYLSVMDEVVDRVRKLREKKNRPVFLTGHSLGGALATICSLDLWVKLNISRREIFVSTFGSPRVGNSYFVTVYREVVPLHWRIVVDPDVIARLPKVGYQHVGKKVVLTPHGEMIIDPSALEQRPWTGETGFAYHRKASYLLAMRAWCVRNHGLTYTPVFWPFPVRPEDERRFAGAFEREEDIQTEGGSSGKAGGRKVAQKIMKLDAMVDALGGGHDEIDNMVAVEKWARLTRRVLLNEKLGGTRATASA